jgi:hypothetical protein
MRAKIIHVAQVYQIHDSWLNGGGMVGLGVDLPGWWSSVAIR